MFVGAACITLHLPASQAQHAEEILDNAMRYIEETRPDVEISDVQVEMLPMEP
jgi:uncharacterized protein YlxP (DUF503 family)